MVQGTQRHARALSAPSWAPRELTERTKSNRRQAKGSQPPPPLWRAVWKTEHQRRAGSFWVGFVAQQGEDTDHPMETVSESEAQGPRGPGIHTPAADPGPQRLPRHLGQSSAAWHLPDKAGSQRGQRDSPLRSTGLPLGLGTAHACPPDQACFPSLSSASDLGLPPTPDQPAPAGPALPALWGAGEGNAR